MAPWFGQVGQPVNFQIGAPNTADYSYDFNFADVSWGTWIPGYNVDHTYTGTGTYGVIARATLLSDPLTVYQSQPHYVSIGTTPVPLPVFAHAHNPAPPAPTSGYNVDFDATGSYSPIGANITSYTVVYGDSATDTNSTGSFSHTYPNPGSGNTVAYTALLTITDEYGESNSITLQVTVWGD
jgi:hypothetical protein